MIDDFLLKLKNRKLVVLMAPVVAGALLGMIFVVKPTAKRLKAIQTEFAAVSEKAVLYSAIAQQEQKIAAHREKLSKITDKTKFIEELNTLAVQSGLSVLSVAADEKRPTMTYLEKINVKMDAEGNYHQLGEFVSRVESLEPFVKVVTVDINTESDRDDAYEADASAAARLRLSRGTYRMTLVLGLFYPAKGVF